MSEGMTGRDKYTCWEKMNYWSHVRHKPIIWLESMKPFDIDQYSAIFDIT